MPASSPLARIYQVIQQVRTSAAENGSIFQKNEAATRAGLIDPMLRALGWDTADVRVVEPEFTVANKQTLDYLLKDVAGRICSVIEAKKLGESLDKLGHVGALIGYAFSLKPKSFFITDGMNWHYYSPTHSSYEPVETLSLQEANSTEAALQLIQWLDAAHSGHGIQEMSTSPLTTLRKNLPPVVVPKKSTKSDVKPIVGEKRPKYQVANFIDVDQLPLLNLAPGQKPKQLRLPNGTIKPVTTWKDILLEVCRLVLDTNHSLTLPLPDKAGKTRFLFSSTKPEKGSSSLASYKGKPVFIGTHYSAADCISNALYALSQLPLVQKPITLAVSF